ncbi:unnamed protein product [Hymenolepis diminuta]|uniref:Cyclin N-terminal domain-containing protein n=1 Tax=Hymenolepis diminuta TaxID=6216 RepID=A0A0R3SHQ6_HYMDI|nr:unnamed protein product [Hymenolepis diminuta]
MESLNRQRPEDVMQLFYDYAEKDDNFMTEIVLNFVNSAVQRQLGKVDSEWLYDFKSYYVKSDVTLFTALVLINRFGNLSPKPSIYYKLTATELLVFATLAAVKFLQDADSVDAVTNQTWAGNLKSELDDIKKAELDFYKALSWDLFVSSSDFVDFVNMKLIAPMRSHIEARNRPKGRPQRFVSHVSNFQTNQLTISSQRRKRVFAKLPSAVRPNVPTTCTEYGLSEFRAPVTWNKLKMELSLEHYQVCMLKLEVNLSSILDVYLSFH